MALLIYIRFFTHTFDKGSTASTILSMFIAVMATVMPMLERMSDNKVASPEAYLWTRQIMSIVKAMLMMTVFIVTGNSNDFFIAWSFFFTTTIGFFYYTLNPYEDPNNYLHE